MSVVFFDTGACEEARAEAPPILFVFLCFNFCTAFSGLVWTACSGDGRGGGGWGASGFPRAARLWLPASPLLAATAKEVRHFEHW